MPKLESQIKTENMQRVLSTALVRRGFNPKALGQELGRRLGKSDPTGRRLFRNPSLLTVGDLQYLNLNDEEIISLVRGIS